MIRFFILWVSLTLLFSGCSVKEYAPSKGKLITIKSNALKFSDVGYVRPSKSGVEVELFSAGQLVEQFRIEDDICTREGCLSRKAFNRRYLHVNYPEEIIGEIFRGEPIFNRAGFEKTATGFKQVVAADEYNIIYKVSQDSIYFKDITNSILIKIREIE
jgi:hypothetical protein